MLKPRGSFCFTSFGPDTLRELRGAWEQVDAQSHVNRFLDMHDLGDALVRAGFAAPVLDVDRLTLTYADLRSLMADLKAVGARNFTAARPRGLVGRDKFAKLHSAYEAFREQGRLPATYEVIYAQAWAPADSSRRHDPPNSSVSLDEIKRQLHAAARDVRPRRLFVTGTDTGVGKTRVAAGLCRAFASRGDRVAAMKPIASGCEATAHGLRNADAIALREAMTVRGRLPRRQIRSPSNPPSLPTSPRRTSG